jgi:hypothetical protein
LGKTKLFQQKEELKLEVIILNLHPQYLQMDLLFDPAISLVGIFTIDLVN